MCLTVFRAQSEDKKEGRHLSSFSPTSTLHRVHKPLHVDEQLIAQCMQVDVKFTLYSNTSVTRQSNAWAGKRLKTLTFEVVAHVHVVRLAVVDNLHDLQEIVLSQLL